MGNRTMGLMLQRQLSDAITLELDKFQLKHQLDGNQLVYWLVSFTWGFCRRLGWSTNDLATYTLHAYEQCEKGMGQLTGDLQAPKREG